MISCARSGAKNVQLGDSPAQVFKKLLHRIGTVEVSRIAETIVGWLPLCDNFMVPEAAHDTRNVATERFDVLRLQRWSIRDHEAAFAFVFIEKDAVSRQQAFLFGSQRKLRGDQIGHAAEVAPGFAHHSLA